MKGHDQVIQVLNDVLTAELTALDQILTGQGQHVDWIEAQLTLIAEVGDAH